MRTVLLLLAYIVAAGAALQVLFPVTGALATGSLIVVGWFVVLGIGSHCDTVDSLAPRAIADGFVHGLKAFRSWVLVMAVMAVASFAVFVILTVLGMM